MKYKKITQQQRVHSRPRPQAKYIFNSPRSFQPLVGKNSMGLRGYTKPALPFKVVGYDFSIENGLRLKPRSNFWLRSTLLITTILTTLPLLWWLNSSSASIPSTASAANKSKVSFPIYNTTTPVAKVASATPISAQSTKQLPISLTQPVSLNPSQPIIYSEPLLNQPVLPWLHLTTKVGDTLATLFEQYQLNKTQLPPILAIELEGQPLQQLQAGQELHIKHDPKGNIHSLILVLNARDELYCSQVNGIFQAKIKPIEIYTKPISQCSTVNTSSMVPDLPQSLLAQLINIFYPKLDLKHQSREGDQFCVIYEERTLESDREAGPILAAEIIQQGQTHRAIRYTDQQGYTGYYTPMGDSWEQLSLLSAPVEFTRISSLFGDRKHPILNKFRTHTGIDYAAPRGTSIVAAGEATIAFIGYKGGYGRTVILEHNQRLHTLYAHLSKYEPELQVGDKVVTGQIIGYVGQSGRTTGPHLHYEIRIDDIPIDPLLAQAPLTMPISDEALLPFFAATQGLINQLNAAVSLSPVRLAENTFFAKKTPRIPITSILEQNSLQPFSLTDMPRISR
ncbi:peptidase M23B [Thioploca ingrica]|uniref:Peptidase M23B n=1 Tax=Thioploca ingrica TaxID=40754 RepID=A0A090AEI1_9GAMM|nr:peptidase M23B [Thioploca ingrica]